MIYAMWPSVKGYVGTDSSRYRGGMYVYPLGFARLKQFLSDGDGICQLAYATARLGQWLCKQSSEFGIIS
jgi:hypothetical protein